MSTTVSAIQTKTNIFIRDTSTNSVSAADRLSAISQATQELLGEFPFDHEIQSYALNYYDSVNTYDISSDIPDLLEPTDLRRAEPDHTDMFVRKQPRDIAYDISVGQPEKSFAIERKNFKTYLVVNYTSRYSAISIHDCDSLAGNGTWQVGETSSSNTSDAENITLDDVEYKQGSGSINFDVDVSDSANNRATISNEDFTSVDLEDLEDIGALIFWVYLPDVTYITSVTAYWGSSTTAYWSASATTALDGSAFVAGWNRIKVLWSAATTTGSPDSTAVNYLRFDFNYSASQTDDTDFRIDDIIMVRPEQLTLYYISTAIGRSNAGAKLYAFTATTDVPFYSGLYDFFDNAIAHKAASILFREMGMDGDSDREEMRYIRIMNDLKSRFPSSQLKEQRAFKVKGIRFSR